MLRNVDGESLEGSIQFRVRQLYQQSEKEMGIQRQARLIALVPIHPKACPTSLAGLPMGARGLVTSHCHVDERLLSTGTPGRPWTTTILLYYYYNLSLLRTIS